MNGAVINCTNLISAPEHVETFKQAFAPVAEHVRRNEPNTLAYEALLSDQDPLKVPAIYLSK